MDNVTPLHPARRRGEVHIGFLASERDTDDELESDAICDRLEELLRAARDIVLRGRIRSVALTIYVHPEDEADAAS